MAPSPPVEGTYSQQPTTNTHWQSRPPRNQLPAFAPFGPPARPDTTRPSAAASPSVSSIPWNSRQYPETDTPRGMPFQSPIQHMPPPSIRDDSHNNLTDPVLAGPSSNVPIYGQNAGKFGRRDSHGRPKSHSGHNPSSFAVPNSIHEGKAQFTSGPNSYYCNPIARPDLGDTPNYRRRSSRDSTGSTNTIVAGSNVLSGEIPSEDKRQFGNPPGAANDSGRPLYPNHSSFAPGSSSGGGGNRNRAGSFRSSRESAGNRTPTPSYPSTMGYPAMIGNVMHPHGTVSPNVRPQMHHPYHTMQPYTPSFVGTPGNTAPPVGFAHSPLGVPHAPGGSQFNPQQHHMQHMYSPYQTSNT